MVAAGHLELSRVGEPRPTNREPIEWLGLMADPARPVAIDRLQSAAHELVLEDDSYRPPGARRQPRRQTP
jgi:hypothetical protein